MRASGKRLPAVLLSKSRTANTFHSFPAQGTGFFLPLLMLILSGCLPMASLQENPGAELSNLPPSVSSHKSAEPNKPHSSIPASEPAHDKLAALPSSAGEISRPVAIAPQASETEFNLSSEIKELIELGKWEKSLPTPPAVDDDFPPYDFPVTMNKQVEFYLDFFQTRHRRHFERWLSRSGRYLPMVQEQLAKAGLPLDLAYLPLIESGYSLTAVSSAKATGPWQFMSATGRHYGLTVNDYVDERRDPVKATKAAVSYLSNLYREFDSWHLAVAAYNAGEGRIRKAIQRSDTDDFWEIANSNYIHSETKLYVPKLIAAIMIAKDPEKYGFNKIDYELPLEYEEVFVPRRTALQAVALACNSTVEDIHRLNRHLSRGITPPNSPAYPLRVPPGKKELVERFLPEVEEETIVRYREHVVGRKENLASICRKYEVSKEELAKINKLGKKKKLAAGRRLKVPYQTVTYRLNTAPGIRQASLAVEKEAELPEIQPVALSQKRESPSEKSVKPEKSERPAPEKKAEKRKKEAADKDDKILLAAKGKKRPGAGKESSATASRKKSKSKPAASYYVVKGGDSLNSIAKKHQLTARQIKSLNRLDGEAIKPGQRLLLTEGKET